jgi:hypothetical protein
LLAASTSPCATGVTALPQTTYRSCSMRSSPPRATAWAWVFRSRVRSPTPTAAGSGRKRTRRGRFTSASLAGATGARSAGHPGRDALFRRRRRREPLRKSQAGRQVSKLGLRLDGDLLERRPTGLRAARPALAGSVGLEQSGAQASGRRAAGDLLTAGGVASAWASRRRWTDKPVSARRCSSAPARPGRDARHRAAARTRISCACVSPC